MILSCVIFLQRLCLFKWENISICIKKKVIILFYPTLFICIVKYWLCHGSYFSLLITATGHIKLTDFGLSKIGLMSCKCHFIAVLCMNKIADIFAEVTFFFGQNLASTYWMTEGINFYLTKITFRTLNIMKTKKGWLMCWHITVYYILFVLIHTLVNWYFQT